MRRTAAQPIRSHTRPYGQDSALSCQGAAVDGPGRAIVRLRCLLLPDSADTHFLRHGSR